MNQEGINQGKCIVAINWQQLISIKQRSDRISVKIEKLAKLSSNTKNKTGNILDDIKKELYLSISEQYIAIFGYNETTKQFH